MRTGAIFARGSCRALKWMAVLGVLVALGSSQISAQTLSPLYMDHVTSNYHAVVDDDGTDSRVLIPMSAGVQVTAAPTSTTPPIVNAITDAFSITGTYQISAVAVTDWQTSGDAQIVAVTLDRSISVGDVPVLTYTNPGTAHNRLQASAPPNADVADFVVTVNPARPELPVRAGNPTFLDVGGRSFTIHSGGAVNWPLPGVEKGGMLDMTDTADPYIQYSAVGATAGDGSNSQTGFTATVGSTTLNSGLTFHAATRSIVGAARDAGTYRITYKALSGDGIAGVTAPDKDEVPVGETGDAFQWFDEKFFDIVITPSDLNGVIEKITVNDDKLTSLGSVNRVHVNEGDRATVKVHVRWSHAQIEALNAGSHTASVDLEVIAYDDPAEWLSKAETSERADGGYGVGDDAVLASKTVSITIPKNPTSNPGSSSHYMTGTGTVSLSLAPDADAEDEAFKIHVVDLTGMNVMTVSPSRTMTDYPILIDDAQTQAIKFTRDPPSTAAIFEGDSVTFKSVPDPPRVDLDLDVRYNVEALGETSVSSGTYTVSVSSGTISATAVPQKHNTTFRTPANDGNRVDDAFEISAEVVAFDLSSGAYTHIPADPPLDVHVLDLHKLPKLDVTKVDPMEAAVDEGESVTITLVIDRNPPTTRRVSGEKVDVSQEELTIMLSPGASSTALPVDDYQIMPNPVTVPERKSGSWIQEVEVEVMARADQAVEDMELLVLDAEVDGTKNAEYGPNTPDDMYMSVSMVTIGEKTTKNVYPKTQQEVEEAVYAAKEAGVGADGIFTAGEMIKVMGSALFNAAEGVTLSYSAETSDPEVATYMVSNGEVTVTAMGTGDAMITIIAHASMPSSVKINPQTDARMASIAFPVEVGLEPLVITLEPPDAGMNLVEGMSYTLTARANRGVEMETMVELIQTGGSASPDDYEVMPITISANESMGTTMLMVKEDGMMENADNMAEMLTLEGRIGTMKTNSLSFYLWDAAVPALPVIAQLLLAVFLAIGGYRRYRRR